MWFDCAGIWIHGFHLWNSAKFTKNDTDIIVVRCVHLCGLPRWQFEHPYLT